MPDKPITVAAYAAGASLAAITAFYIFSPTFFLDASSDPGNTSRSDAARRKGIVGLHNPANDCFINSVLQALAGLGDLRVYLIKELYRRELDGAEVYSARPADTEKLYNGETAERVVELQQAWVTASMKHMLDALNERPIIKRTITAQPFIQSLERAFHTHIRRTQQDAHEFLQVVIERLCDEYHASANARQRASKHLPAGAILPSHLLDEKTSKDSDRGSALTPVETGANAAHIEDVDSIEPGFPLEGTMESQIECQQCRYQYKPNPTKFVNLTLQVPQKSAASLNSCFDGLLKTEFIDDFKCDKCRLQHAIAVRTNELSASSDQDKENLTRELDQLRDALARDPESPPQGIVLPSDAPKSRIGRHMRITDFPQVLTIHLSRSIFESRSSTKNAAKVEFPERLCLGPILEPKYYKLLGIVCHKGSHHSGHYESFRRNFVYAPYSNPDAFRSFASGSRATSASSSVAQSPALHALKEQESAENGGLECTASPSPSPLAQTQSSSDLSPSPSLGTISSTATSATTPNAEAAPRSSMQSTRSRTRRLADSILPSSITSPRAESSGASILSRRSSRRSSRHRNGPTSSPQETPIASSSTAPTSNPSPASSNDPLSQKQTTPAPSFTPKSDPLFRKRKKYNDRWWRISDEKIKECKTKDVLDMQKEVYLLFYELERVEDRVVREGGAGGRKR